MTNATIQIFLNNYVLQHPEEFPKDEDITIPSLSNSTDYYPNFKEYILNAYKNYKIKIKDIDNSSRK
jgi:hypothetical protein